MLNDVSSDLVSGVVYLPTDILDLKERFRVVDETHIF